MHCSACPHVSHGCVLYRAVPDDACMMQCLLGRAKRSPFRLGGAKTGSLVRHGCAIVFGTSRLCNNFWYVAVAQYFTLYGTFAALRNSLGVVACLRNCLPSLVRK